MTKELDHNKNFIFKKFKRIFFEHLSFLIKKENLFFFLKNFPSELCNFI